ncbi:hypothetical protein [Mesorhizobium sp.]|uniref:hypothetical protein n=1 Tax=Mesorhizobium sp. TaxID=1871066 RepID=UPI000FE6FE9B|nr:hypothetical protein [Mesorhizobium sp.]RWI96788.1 MAG: hypothetical protein EOR22_08660 [Mesorhizobium sp.]TIQ09398.1 MAG: hypothetical protein E5X50_00390 [Mesorhizobium sp.]TIR24671.1 MAG: hypothetical protein E5X33_02100 [Mesorhizobium sp.]
MKHQTLDQLHAVAEVRIAKPVMSRTQRLARWAELLEREPNRLLTALIGTEYRAPRERNVMRGAGSPISVALEDPVLHEEGLKNDTYGEAKRFFELTDYQLHEIVCYCHVGDVMRASRAALSVRAVLD